MKIIAFLNSYIQGLSGGDVRFIELLKILKEKFNFNISVITSLLGEKFSRARGLDANYILVTREKQVRTLPILYLARIVKAILLLKNEYRSDIILFSSTDYLPDVIPAFYLKKRLRVPWIASVYHLIPPPSLRSGGFRKIDNILSYVNQQISLRILASYADIIQTETNFVKYYINRYFNIPTRKIVVIPGGIDKKTIDSVSCNGKKIYDACFLARIHPTKGIYELVDAWRIVCNNKPNAILAIAGSGSNKYIKILKNRIKEKGLQNNITFFGFLSEKDKYKLFKSSKVYVLPSHEEGIPLTFFEAMYCGLPIITYYLPSYKDIKDYIISVPKGDINKLAYAILQILENKKLMEKMKTMGRNLAEKYTWNNVVKQMVTYIKNMTNDEYTNKKKGDFHFSEK